MLFIYSATFINIIKFIYYIATRDQWRNNSRKDEEMEPKQKQHPAVDATGDRSKV